MTDPFVSPFLFLPSLSYCGVVTNKTEEDLRRRMQALDEKRARSKEEKRLAMVAYGKNYRLRKKAEEIQKNVSYSEKQILNSSLTLSYLLIFSSFFFLLWCFNEPAREGKAKNRREGGREKAGLGDAGQEKEAGLGDAGQEKEEAGLGDAGQEKAGLGGEGKRI